MSHQERFITLGKLEKILHMFLNNIDCEILVEGGMRFEKKFKFYSKNQWMSKSKHS